MGKIFARFLAWSVKNDQVINKIVRDADNDMAKSRKEILKRCDGDKEKVKKAIPKNVRKALGFDF